MRIAGARTLITGATGGIGTALAVEFGRRHAVLTLHGRDVTRLLTQQAAQGAHVVVTDLAADGGAQQVAAEAGEVDILICNAGVGWYGTTSEMPCRDIRQLIDVNLAAPLLLSRLFLPGMIERRRGHIVLVGSVAGHLGVENEAVYSATKAGLRAYAESIGPEVCRYNIGVSVVSPGAVDTEFFNHRGHAYQRMWPPAIPAAKVARAAAAAVEHERRQIFVPRWLKLPTLIHGGFPALYRGLAHRFG